MAERVTMTQPFPLFFEQSAPFLISGAGNNRSGAEGAVAKMEFKLPNDPQSYFMLRVSNTYEFAEGITFLERAAYRLEGTLGGLDDAQTVEIKLAQQNITAQPVTARNLNGLAGINWHPFPCAYLLRGANTVQVIVTRLLSYPPTSDDSAVLPVCRATLVSVEHDSDLLPGRAPGSTMRPS